MEYAGDTNAAKNTRPQDANSQFRRRARGGKEHGLTWFDLEGWNATREAWETLGTWATDDAGKWVSIPASER